MQLTTIIELAVCNTIGTVVKLHIKKYNDLDVNRICFKMREVILLIFKGYIRKIIRNLPCFILFYVTVKI